MVLFALQPINIMPAIFYNFSLNYGNAGNDLNYQISVGTSMIKVPWKFFPYWVKLGGINFNSSTTPIRKKQFFEKRDIVGHFCKKLFNCC